MIYSMHINICCFILAVATYAYMYTCMYRCMYVCMYIYICIYIYIYTERERNNIYMYIPTLHVYTCIHTNVCGCVCVDAARIWGA